MADHPGNIYQDTQTSYTYGNMDDTSAWYYTNNDNTSASTSASTGSYRVMGVDWGTGNQYISSGNQYIYWPKPTRWSDKILVRLKAIADLPVKWKRDRERRRKELEKALAESKAVGLLHDLFQMVEGQKHLLIESETPGRVYIVPLNGQMPEQWDNGKMTKRFCIQWKGSKERPPKTDLVIARALMLQTSEAEFLKVANGMRAL